VVDKAAAIIRGIVADHPFVDGNKRTAILSGLTLLELNGIKFKVVPGEIEDFAVVVATSHLDIQRFPVGYEITLTSKAIRARVQAPQPNRAI